MLLHLLPMHLVLRIENHRLVFPFQNDIGDERFLRSEIWRGPIQGRQCFPFTLSSEHTAYLVGNSRHNRLRPGLEELFHRHCPCETLQIAQSCEASLICRPFNRLDSGSECFTRQTSAEPTLKSRRSGRSRRNVSYRLHHSLTHLDQLENEWTATDLSLQACNLLLKRESNRPFQHSIVPQIRKPARH